VDGGGFGFRWGLTTGGFGQLRLGLDAGKLLARGDYKGALAISLGGFGWVLRGRFWQAGGLWGPLAG